MKGKEIKKIIEKKFNDRSCFLSLVPIPKRDHLMYKIYYKNTYLGIFQISFGSREFGPKLISLMSHQLGINSQQLRELVSCTFWGKDFLRYSQLLK